LEEQATSMAMVAAGLGVTLVSDLGLALRPPGVDIVPLGDALTRTVSLAYRTNSAGRAALLLVVDAIRTAAAKKGLAPDIRTAPTVRRTSDAAGAQETE
ncbi:LysR substrate-binding domain-containing protein, partial [Nocardia sp. NPDC060220]